MTSPPVTGSSVPADPPLDPDARDTPRNFARSTLTHDAAWTLAYHVVVRAATMGVSIAVARLAGPAGSGALGVALQVTALGAILAAFNLPQSLSRHLAASDDPAVHSRLLRTSGTIVLLAAALVGVAISALSPWLGDHVYRDPTLTPVLLWCGPLVIATSSMLWVEGALQGLRRFPSLTRWGSAISALDLAVGVVTAFFGVVAVVAGRVLIRAGAVLIALTRWFRSTRLAAPGGRGEFRLTLSTLLSFAAPVLLSSVTLLAAQAALRLLLVRSAGIESAGHYQAADSIAQVLSLIPTAASVALMRSVATGESTGYAGLENQLRRALERVAGWNLPLCLAVIGAVPWALRLLLGEGFEPARPVLVVLAASFALFGPCAVLGSIMLGRGEVWTGVAVNVLWCAAVLATFAFAGVRYGAVGAALAVLAGYVAMLTVCLLVVVPRWSVPVRALLPVTLVSLAAIALAAAAAVSPAIPPFATAALCGGLAFAAFWRWGRVSWSWPGPVAPTR
jgi:O-antigen/teichoic acid export membrane protein